jgi:hypothetical protein
MTLYNLVYTCRILKIIVMLMMLCMSLMEENCAEKGKCCMNANSSSSVAALFLKICHL